MRYLLALIVAAAASPVFAQKELPDMFFVECDKERILVLVDRKQQVFELKLPFLKNVLTEENSDRIAEISDKGYHEMQFNKWNGAFSFGSHQWDDCQMLDPDSRQPLFK